MTDTFFWIYNSRWEYMHFLKLYIYNTYIYLASILYPFLFISSQHLFCRVLGWRCVKNRRLGCTHVNIVKRDQISKKRDHHGFGVLCFSVLCVWGSWCAFCIRWGFKLICAIIHDISHQCYPQCPTHSTSKCTGVQHIQHISSPMLNSSRVQLDIAENYCESKSNAGKSINMEWSIVR